MSARTPTADYIAPSGQPTGEAARHLRPLAELTQFRTRKGNLILYEPESKDTWIGKEVFEDDDIGGYRDGKTGKPLSKRLAASYLAYRRRHSARCSAGDKVDKYLHLVDKYQPQVSAEARIYVARFPEEVGDLLKQIKRVRKLVRKSRRKRRQRGRTTPKTVGEPDARDVTSEAVQCGVPDQDQTQGGALTTTRATRVTKETTGTVSETQEGVREDTPPDWGSHSDEDTNTQPAGEWPWGRAGRPSDRGDSPGHLAVRPNEPEMGASLRLVPNEHWRGVQTVQAHMARARAKRARSEEA